MALTVGKKLTISTLLFSITAIIPFCILAVMSVTTARQSFIDQKFEQLTSARELKKEAIIAYFKQNQNGIESLARSKDVLSMFDVLKQYHVDTNVSATGNYDVKSQVYQKIYSENAEFLNKYVEHNGLYDMFIICAAHGHVMYSQAKESDLGENLKHGPLKNSGLGELWRTVIEKDSFTFVDFAPYAPSNDAPAAFIGVPIKKSGVTVAVLAIQLPIEKINTIMQQREGMGETGETYLVGPDKLMRSDSFLDQVNHTMKASFANPGKGSVDTEASTDALAGKTNQKIIIDYNGNPVLSSYTSLKVGNTHWALISEIDKEEVVNSSVAAERLLNVVWTIGIISIVIVLAVIIFSTITIQKMTSKMRLIINDLNEGSSQVSSASNQLSSSSQQVADGASEQAASLEETSSSLEEMSSMTRQNAENAESASILSTEAKETVDGALSTMDELLASMKDISESSEETSKIVKTIDEIAFQTNLLALNAAVEAARAGEVGAGFAVVADEVRNLAMRAAAAAQETSELIDTTVERVKRGNTLVIKTNDTFRMIEESTKKVVDLIREISAASKEQSVGISQVSQAVTQMDQVVQGNSATAEESASASEELNAQAAVLGENVDVLVEMIIGLKTSSKSITSGSANEQVMSTQLRLDQE